MTEPDDDDGIFKVEKLCRVCLTYFSQNELAYDLFAVAGLASKLSVCAAIAVEPDDGLPRKLCSQCYQRLNDLHEFRIECLNSKRKFQQLISPNLQIKCPELILLDEQVVMAVDDLDPPDADISIDPFLNCNEFETVSIVQIVSELGDTNNDDESIKFEASDSNDDELPLAQRLRKKPALVVKLESPSSDNDDSDGSSSLRESTQRPKRGRRRRADGESEVPRVTIECHICQQKFKKQARYDDHMKHHNDLLPYQCQVATCRKGFTTANGLRLHVDHAHAELAEIHSCTIEGCERTFPRLRLLTWHLRKEHNIFKSQATRRTYPCAECDKVFRCPMALKKHNYKHDGKELPYPCNICGKRFVINSALKDHLMRHAGIKNYICPYCGVGKTTRQEWNTHILTHTQEKKFKCHICEHASHNKQSLANHVKIVHEKIKNYTCQHCGKKFGKSHACKIHEMTHTGEKRCECKVCGKRFLYPKSLTKHLKTHEKRVLRSLETYQQRQQNVGEVTTHPPINGSATDTLLKVCAESVATIPKDPRRVERVDLVQLAGTAVNPITLVSLPPCPTQDHLSKKEGKYMCPGCGQKFNNIGNMKRHYKIIHEKVKDFACRYCTRRFAKAQTLKHHEWTHTGEKPYECKTCGTRFRQDVALKRHQKVHQLRPPVIPNKYYAAKEELQVQERQKLAAKRKAELKREEIAAAARVQLEILIKQGAEQTNTYEKYAAAAANSINYNSDEQQNSSEIDNSCAFQAKNAQSEDMPSTTTITNGYTLLPNVSMPQI